MPKLPVLKPEELVKILKKNGFEEVRQVGNHLHLFNPESQLRATIPIHNKELKRKTLISILRQANIKL